MKKFLAVMAIIALFWAGGSWIGAQIEVTTSTVITIASRAVDDTGTYVTPDSVRIVVYREGVEAFDDWFNSADGQCSELNDQLVFFDAFGDIDGGAGTGIYQVSANFYKGDDQYWVNTWYNLVDTTTQSYGSLQFHYRLSPTTAGRTLDVTATGEAGIDLDNVSGTLDAGEFGADFITAAKIADDAIDYATFAESAPSAWWNEGKTGYALTTAERKAIADSVHFADTTQYSGTDTTMGQMGISAATAAVATDYSDEIDSLLAVLYDRTNDSNFVRLMAHLILHAGVDIAKISGDATAADNAEYFFDGTGITQDLDIKMRSLEVYSDVGDAALFQSTYTSGTGLYVAGTGTGGYGLKAYGHAAGNDVYLAGTGKIAGTIDSCAGPAYAGATLDTIRAHAPHGDNWAAGTGVSAIVDTVNAILDSIQAHAPHGDDWGQGAGSLVAEVDSILEVLYDRTNDSNFVRIMAHILQVVLDDSLGLLKQWGLVLLDDSLGSAKSKVHSIYNFTDGDLIGGIDADIGAIITDIENIDGWNPANGVLAWLDGDSLKSMMDTIWAIRNYAHAVQESINAHAPHGDNWASVGAGSGLRTVNIYVQDASDSSGLQSYEVSVTDSSSGTDKGRISTDSDGLATFSLDDDTYTIAFSAPAGWTITSPVYLTVTANDDTTYYATQYSPTPPSASYCIVYTYTYKLTGAYSGCRLEARIPPEYGVVTSSTFLTVPYVVADTSEADGKVELPLVRSTNLTSSAGLTPVKVHLQLFDPWGNVVADTLMEIPDQASKVIWITP